MAKYGGFLYRGGYYGEIPRLPFSVEPFQGVAVDYDKVLLSWGSPQGAINGLRLVRNQVGFGEWPEDGVVLFERTSDGGDFGDGTYIDGQYNFEDDNYVNDIPLVSGKFVYYRMWVRRSSTNLWTAAEGVVVVLPKPHGTTGPDGETFITTHDSTMDLLPRVFTSATQAPLDPVDLESDLYKFLKAFSFTLDEYLTLADLLLPDFSGRSTNPALLDLQTAQLGLSLEDRDFVIRQKRMVREALYMYSRKGTKLAIGTLVESLTGFAPTITESPNLMLSNQDSTFNDSLGNWKIFGDGFLTVSAEIRPPSGEELAIESNYSAKIVVNSPAVSITNGKENTITKGIPVKSGTEYVFSFYAQSKNNVELVSVAPRVNWHDSGGKVIGTSVGDTTPTTISWAEYSLTAEAPGRDFLITEYTVASSVVTATTSETHVITAGSAISVIGLGVPFDGKFTVDSVTGNTITYTIESSTADVTVTDLQGVISIAQAVYASLEIEFDTVGTVYVDLIQLADSTTTQYYEARGIDIFLSPSKSNYINNPSFSGVTQGWNITGGSEAYVDDTMPYIYAGDSMLQITASGGAISVSANTLTGGMPTGKFYTFSVFAQCPTVDEEVYVQLTAVDSVNATITEVGEAVTVSSEWTRLKVTTYIPAEFVSDSMYFTVDIKVNTATSTNIVNFEAAQLEAAFDATLYIDGSYPTEYGIVWEGTNNNSPSHLYKNKNQKIIRLIQELEDFLPSNTPYAVKSFGGIETAAITR